MQIIRVIVKLFLAFQIKVYYPLFNGLYLKYHHVKAGKNTVINGKPFIINKGGFNIADNVVINSAYRNNPIGGNTFSSFWVKPGGAIYIGQGCKISNTAFVSAKNITIGKNVYIGGNCKIYDTDFHSLNCNERLMVKDPGINNKAVFIDDNVFIGGSTLILKGVTIGKNAVIGAGSVVTKAIPENEVWAGNPASKIKLI